MKKIRILSAIIAVCAIVALFPMALSASAEKLTLDIGNKTDVLTDEIAYLNGPSQSDTVVDNLTDGIYASNAGEKVYLNKSWCSKEAYPTIEQEPGTYTFNIVGGTTNTYYYTITFEELNVNCDSFAMYFNNENAYADDDAHFPIYHIDSSFDILVSTDGGNTYSVAYSSVPLTIDTEGNVVSAAGMTTDVGGNCVEVKLKDEAGTVNCTYKYIEGNFDKEYKNVTNIVYAASRVRRANITNTTTITSGAFYYAIRMTEMDVYGSKNEATSTTEEVTTAAATADDTTAEVTTAAAEVTTAEATTAAATTAAAEVTTVAPTTEKAEESSCGSSVACGAAVMVSILGAALLRKKH